MTAPVVRLHDQSATLLHSHPIRLAFATMQSCSLGDQAAGDGGPDLAGHDLS